jgi:MFS family permease
VKQGSAGVPDQLYQRRPLFYGWYIVGVGFLSNVACSFHLSSTLSIFLKPLTEDLEVSRGLFSLLRSGEILIGAAMAPVVGPLVDRYGARWLMAGGALAAGLGLLLLSQVGEFWQFLLLRWSFITFGGACMCSMVVTVTISRWFIRKRGRAIAVATLGQGLAKVCIPLIAASLFLWLGWRGTWAVFGALTLGLVTLPAAIFMRRHPEEMGLHPDGAARPYAEFEFHGMRRAGEQLQLNDRAWSRKEALSTRTFWLIALTFGIANVGVAGLNLHVFAYVSDLGFPAVVAATVMSIIAFTQLASTLFWGFLSERIDIRKAVMLEFLFQAFGLSLAILAGRIAAIYAGFFLYGIGLGGSQVLQEIIWANYYGRVSLGTVRGLGLLITYVFGAIGPPFFGFLFDATKSYFVSFSLFAAALLVSAFLVLWLRPPQR